MLAVEPQANVAMAQWDPGVRRKPDDHRHTDGGPVSDRRAELLAAYRHHRIATQQAFYAKRAEQNETARRWAVTATATLLVLAALFGALATADAERRTLWAFVAASMSALATGLTSYDAAFGFERLARQYGETSSALALADVFGPRPEDLDRLADDTERDKKATAFVAETEQLLRSEVDTWSQQAATPPEHWPPDRAT
jgi:SMODS and SLOG-associating 2TM effector domain 1